MNNYIVAIIFALLLGAGNSIYHAERLKKLEKPRNREDVNNWNKVFNILVLIFYPLIIYFGYILFRRSILLFGISVVVNMPPINILCILIANIVVIPMSIFIAKLFRIKI